MRLNKYISHNTKYSRREADKLIEEGEVTLTVVGTGLHLNAPEAQNEQGGQA